MSATGRTPPIGDTPPRLVFGPVTRAELLTYSQASGDRNPLHLDTEVAKRAGFSDVIAQGMLAMAFATRALEHWFGIDAIRLLQVRFVDSIALDSVLEASATVSSSSFEEASFEVEITIKDQKNVSKLVGDASLTVAR